MNRYSIIRSLSFTALLLIVLSACSVESQHVAKAVEDQLQSMADRDNPHVLSVKNGYPTDYPGQLYGDAFDQFFGSPTWTYFKADSGEHVVEFTGIMMYMENEVKARLQFIVDDETNTFEAGALSFNDVPQNRFITSQVLQAVFEDSSETKQGSKNNTEEVEEPVRIIKEDLPSIVEDTDPPSEVTEILEHDHFYFDPNNELNQMVISIDNDIVTGTITTNTVRDNVATFDFSGTLKDGTLTSSYEDDWGESGTFELLLTDGKAIVSIFSEWSGEWDTYTFIE